MAAEEHLTDAQIVSELAKYGEKVELPLKRHKRPVLLKKLNHLRVRSNKERAAATPPRKSSQSPASAFNKFKDRRNDETETEQRNKVQIPKSSNPYTRDSRRNITDSFRQSNSQTLVSDDSDHDVHAPSGSSSNYNRLTPKSYRNLDDEEPIASRSSTRYSLADQYFTKRVPGTLKHTTALSSRAYDIRDENQTFSQNHEDDDDDEKPLSPPRSRLYPDLGRFTPSYLRSDRFESSDSDIDERANKSFPYSPRVTRPRDDSSSFTSRHHRTSIGTPNRGRQPKSSYFARLPRIFIIIAVLFFVVVAASYIVKNKDYVLSWFPSSGSDDVLLICSNTSKTKGCYDKQMVDQALQYLGKLFEILSFKKGQVLCGDAKPGQDFLTVSDLQSQMYKHFPIEKTNVELLLECCLQHILLNPHWKIRALQENGTAATSKEEVAKLESEEPSMGILCRLRRSCFTVLYELCLTAAAIAIFVVLFMLVRYRLKKNELEQREVYEMVDEIIEILQDHYEHTKGKDSDESTYLAVQHVRDQLLPPSTRHRLQPVWDKAVAFIAANESRVRMETRLIQGDEFDVWRWLQPPVPENRSKKIPGLASKYIERDKQVSQKPTVCLKICKMYNSSVVSDDDWEEEVIDAVLEKCRGVDGVVHARVDAQLEEGCVFMKCSDLEAAVEAKDELHGWRRKGQTVTVKYMKTDEYHKLFPEARYTTRPLYPSTARARM